MWSRYLVVKLIKRIGTGVDSALVPTPTLVLAPARELTPAMELAPAIIMELIPAIEWNVDRVTHLWAVPQSGG